MIDKTELYYSHESINNKINICISSNDYFVGINFKGLFSDEDAKILKNYYNLVEVRNLRIIDCEVNKFWINQIKNLLKNLRKYQLLIFAEN